MGYYTKKFINVATSIPLSRVSRPGEVSSFINHKIRDSQYDYHETEAFEVTEVILNKPMNRASVKGRFINDPTQPILGGVVKPKDPLKVAVPLVGEQVDVIELNGQHYYSNPVNLKGSVNENSIPGASGGYVKNTKYGETFKRKNVKPLEIGEGCVLFEGRFGQSVHFDGHHNVPSIKIRTNIDTGEGDFTTEDIDEDDSSIYLTSDGLRGKSFEGEKIEGKNILIKSDSIFIKGDDIRLGSRVDTKLQPVVKGNDLKKLLDQVFQATINSNQSLITQNLAEAAVKTNAGLLAEAAKLATTNTELDIQNKQLKSAITKAQYLSNIVKTT